MIYQFSELMFLKLKFILKIFSFKFEKPFNEKYDFKCVKYLKINMKIILDIYLKIVKLYI